MRHLALPGGFPAPTAADLAETRRLLADVPAETVILADGLAYGAMPAESDLRTDESDRRAGAPSAVPGGRPRQGRVRTNSTRWRRPRWRAPGTSSSPARPRRHCSPPTSRVPAGKHHRRRARHRPGRARTRHRAARCSCSRSARSCRARPMTCWCAHWPAEEPRLAAHHRRTHRSQRTGLRGAAGGHRRHRTWATHRAHRRGRPGAVGQIL